MQICRGKTKQESYMSEKKFTACMVRKEDDEDARGRPADSSNVELLTNESFKTHFTRKLIKKLI